MAAKFMSMKNLKFTLHDVVNAEEITAAQGHTKKSLNMILDALADFAKKELHPTFEEMDRQPPEMKDNTTHVHPSVRPVIQTLGEDGWIASIFPEKWGGEEMSSIMMLAMNYIFASANYSASAYTTLTQGAARLILTYGSEELQNRYIPPMLEGKWQGTMALTEPEAGSSLGDLTTMAVPAGDGTYKISGEKCFISAGDHDGVDNVVHLMLAKVKGAPAGVKGISLFVVPKKRVDDQGNLESNDVALTQVFHKLGYRGCPITGLRMGEKNDCTGYLVGKENHGLAYMFQMMNGARLDVGMGATAIATAAYQASLDYAKTRKQGRKISDKKAADMVPIIEHPDVKRMLLFQRAVSEGALSLIIQCGRYEDLSLVEGDKQKDYHLLLEILTPIAKTYPSEMGILSTSQAIQILGGYGYCDDFPVEQHFRDMRIHTIHEGTTGIQGMDLLGRKVVMNEGRALTLLTREIRETIEKAGEHESLNALAGELESCIKTVEETTVALKELATEKGQEAYLADATAYLEMFGLMVIGWQWLAMATAAAENLTADKLKKKDKNFYEGKIAVCRYFFSHELAKTSSLAQVLSRKGSVLLDIQKEMFAD